MAALPARVADHLIVKSSQTNDLRHARAERPRLRRLTAAAIVTTAATGAPATFVNAAAAAGAPAAFVTLDVTLKLQNLSNRPFAQLLTQQPLH